MSRKRAGSPQGGVTLAEMLITVSLVALTATVIIPSAAPVGNFAAEAVAGEVARAMRFARREAIRTNSWYVVRLEPADQSISVYRPTADSKTVAAMASHPIDRTAYRIDLSRAAGARGQIALSEFTYDDNSIRNYVGFGPDGAPGIQDASVSRLLKTSARVVIRHGRVEREVAVHPVTGRITQ